MGTVETVQRIYEAFGAGDVPAMLELLADDVEWEPSPRRVITRDVERGA